MSKDIRHECQENEFGNTRRIVRTTRFYNAGDWFLQLFEPFTDYPNRIVRITYCPFCGENLEKQHHINYRIKKPHDPRQAQLFDFSLEMWEPEND